jgi:O-glycosyl hydrolase
MQNGQEGCHYEPDEAAGLTKALIQAVQENDLDVKISVFESGEWKNSTEYIDQLLGDPEIAPHLDHLAIHSYWSSIDDKERLVRYLDQHYPDFPIEMTEWTEMEQGRDIRMDSALLLANTIYEDLTIGRVITWQYWIAVSKYNFHDGLIYVALNDHEITETKRLWAMGNYSRYVRPGYVRIAAESSVPRLRATAFLSPDQAKLVMVVINNDGNAVSVSLDPPANFSQVAAFQTSKELDLAEIYDGVTPEVFTFAPESVTTLQFQK